MLNKSEQFNQLAAGSSDLDDNVLKQKEIGLRELFRNTKNPVEVILQDIRSDKMKEAIGQDLLNSVEMELSNLLYNDEDDFINKIKDIAHPIWSITQKDKKDLFKQGGREMFTKEDVEEAAKKIQESRAEKIYIIGNVGSGKSTFARELSQQINFKNIDVDHFFQIFRQEKNKEASLPELMEFIMAREKPPYIINHADLLNQKLSDQADMIVLLDPKKDEMLKSRSIRESNKADGEWKNVSIDDYDKISQDNKNNLNDLPGSLVYANDKSGTSIKFLKSNIN